MKSKMTLSCLAALLLPASAALAVTVSDWTFETSEPGVVDGPASPGANTWITNITAEAGSTPGTASGLHAAAATVYSSPAGNGSSHCFSANTWTVGDCYQFAVSTVGVSNIIVTYDQISSSTGPGFFNFEYSTDGVNFTTYSNYPTLVNGGSTTWSSGTHITNSSYSNNFTGVTALNNAPVVYFRLVDSSTTSAGGGTVAVAGTDRVDNFLVSGSSGSPPVVYSLQPSSQNLNAGNPGTFTVIMSAGDTPMSFLWYQITPTATNLIYGQTNAYYTNYLDFSSVVESNSGSYIVVVSNHTGVNVTNGPATLSVNDPFINQGPFSQTGLVGGSAQFSVIAGGTGLGFQWYFANGSTPVAPVPSTLPSGTTATGTTSSNLTLSNLHAADNGSNFLVVVTGNAPGNDSPQTSAPASLSVASSGVSLAYWTFNGNYLNVTNPVPYLGSGTASSMNVTPFLQPNQDADDSTTLSPNNGWGTEDYPASGLNKQAGVQFNTSTAGARHINVAFDIRATSTASAYQRLQYTTDGSTWIDYPASEMIPAGDASIWESEPQIFNWSTYNLTGVQGVDNNPNFGIRIVSEFESTALYGDTNLDSYVGVSATYATGGTISLDIVNITGDAITDSLQPPVITPPVSPKMSDGTATTINFSVSDASAPVSTINWSAQALNSSINVSVGTPTYNGGSSVKMTVNSSSGATTTYYTPILLTATDANGTVGQAWFTLEIDPADTPPVLAGLSATNMLPNCIVYPGNTLAIPFTASVDHGSPTQLTMTKSSGNSTLVPNNASHLSLSSPGANQTLSITPATNQEGAASFTVSATDTFGKSTSETNYVEVRPTTNILIIDNFGYDNNGSTAIVSNSGGLWQTHSGTAGQLNAGGGVATIDGVDNTEDVNAQFIGGPIPTNGPAVLYSCYTINYSTLPSVAGSYITHFKDLSTSNFYGRVWASIDGAAPGYYRLGIANVAAAWTNAAQFPQDLSLNSNYLVVTRMVLANFQSTLWINPINEASFGVTDPSVVIAPATNIAAYAFRESNTNEGILNVAQFRVGTSFDSVLPEVQLTKAPPKVILTWNEPTLPIASGPTVTGPWTIIPGSKSPYTNNTGSNQFYFKLAQ